MDSENNELSAGMQEEANASPFAPQTPEDFQCIEETSAIFTGTSRHGLDAKGRVVIPQAFRKKLGEKFVIGPSADFKSIAVYPILVWARNMRQLKSLSEYRNPAVMKQIKMMTSLSLLDQECDAQGRILLPAVLRQRMLGDEREVNITGNDDCICITSSQSTDDEWESFMRTLDATQEQIHQAIEHHRNKT